MDNQRRLTFNYFIDIFNRTFEENIIEAVLEQCDWNADRALNDLILMVDDAEVNLSTENFPQNSIPSDSRPNGQLCEKIENASHNSTDTADKTESEDGVNEEEFYSPTESISEIEKSPSLKPDSELNPSAKSLCTPSTILFPGNTLLSRRKRARHSLKKVKLFVRDGLKIMIILRGCSGSGKSTFAKNILKECDLTENPYWYIHSSDNYFHLNTLGTYHPDRTKVLESHKWNHANVSHVVRQGLTPVIVDNTNIEMWQMKAYAAIAVRSGYEIEIIEPDTKWAFDTSELVKKNVHSVSKGGIKDMMRRYEYNVTSSLLLKSINLEYTPANAPPQVGSRELSNKKLISLFQSLYYVILVFPEQLEKLKKQQGVSRNAVKEIRKMKDQLNEIIETIKNSANLKKDDDEDQLECLGSLQNVVNIDVNENNPTKEKNEPTSEKSKNESKGNGKNERRNNSHFDGTEEPPDTPKNIKRKKFQTKDDRDSQKSFSDDSSVVGFVSADAELKEERTKGSFELFLDTTTVSQLIPNFGNRTIYSLKDYQPNGCNYYETKTVMNRMRQGVPTNLSFNLENDRKSLADTTKSNDTRLFESTSISLRNVNGISHLQPPIRNELKNKNIELSLQCGEKVHLRSSVFTIPFYELVKRWRRLPKSPFVLSCSGLRSSVIFSLERGITCIFRYFP